MAKNAKVTTRDALLRAFWNEVPPDDSKVWRKQLGGLLDGRIERLLAGTGTEEDLLAIVRQATVNALLSFVGVLDGGPEDAATPGWAVFEVGKNDKPGKALGELHGDLFEMDPTGRRMDPLKDKAPRGAKRAASPKRRTK